MKLWWCDVNRRRCGVSSTSETRSALNIEAAPLAGSAPTEASDQSQRRAAPLLICIIKRSQTSAAGEEAPGASVASVSD